MDKIMFNEYIEFPSILAQLQESVEFVTYIPCGIPFLLV